MKRDAIGVDRYRVHGIDDVIAGEASAGSLFLEAALARVIQFGRRGRMDVRDSA